MKRFENGLYLLLFYNDHNDGYASNSRNPYWLACGRESEGVILWSQPEIILYDRDDVDDRPGYPDFIQDPLTGLIYITETQKTTARIHKVRGRLWKMDGHLMIRILQYLLSSKYDPSFSL